MTSIRLPRLMDSHLNELYRLEPTHLSIQLNMSLSTATMTLPPQSPQVTTGQLVELYTQQGSAGIFRVQQVERDWNTATRISLNHALVTLADTTIPGTGETRTLPAAQLFTQLLAHQSLWQPGDVEVPADVLFTLRHKDANLLESLTDLMAELPDYRLDFDQTVFPWKLHLRALSNSCVTECRLTRNLRSLTIETDRSELCTRLYLPGVEAPLEADTIAQWGVVSRSLDASADLTAEELTRRGQRYLDLHKDPQVTVTMDGVDITKSCYTVPSHRRRAGQLPPWLPLPGLPAGGRDPHPAHRVPCLAGCLWRAGASAGHPGQPEQQCFHRAGRDDR